MSKNWKGGPFGVFQHPFCRRTSENWKIFIFGKKSHSAEKNCKGDPLGFSNIHSDANQQKIEGGPFGEKLFFEKKSRSAEKNERGDPLVSPGMVCYAEKQEKPFGSVR